MRSRAIISRVGAALGLLICLPTIAISATPGPQDRADEKALATLQAMTKAEQTVLTHGRYASKRVGALPEGAVPGAGFVPGIPRLGLPALRETDASLGVAYLFGDRNDGATALPSGVAMAATWNPELLWRGGAMIGSEARAKGFNVMLAGGANLIRDPRNGRTFEYLSEDPLLTGELVGAAIAGIQSNHIISTIKHFALNAQETGRFVVDARLSEAAMRESDLLAFQIGIERGRPGAVMCAYNFLNGAKACDNDWLLNKVLKTDWRYAGFVMSDWGAVPHVEAAIHGLDQQSGEQFDKAVFFGSDLARMAQDDGAYALRVKDMNRRILRMIYAHELDRFPAEPGGAIDVQANAAVAEEIATQGIVLLRNERNALPLASTVGSIAVIGGYAAKGVLSGGGSSQVQGQGGPAVSVPSAGTDLASTLMTEQYHASSPYTAIKARAKSAKLTVADGRYIADAVAHARAAQVAIVFATQWQAEGRDQPDLSLPNGQDALIEAVAQANPNTIVVLETGGPVAMPWLEKTSAVIQAWYPGARGGEAIAAILFGEANPSGKLPVTFPASVEQLPRPVLDGLANFADSAMPTGSGLTPSFAVDYDVEGSDVGYRWFARKGERPLFPFGFGLSYTTFEASGLRMKGLSAQFTVRNTGRRAGATVAQLYLVSRNGQARRRLVGFQRLDLAAGEARSVSLTIDPRLLADWSDGAWSITGGQYAFALGADAEQLATPRTVRLGARRWKD